MKQTMKRPLSQPLIFNSGAIREDLKQDWEALEFWTCTVDLQEYPKETGLLPTYRRGIGLMTEGNLQDRLQTIIDWPWELQQEDALISKMPHASLTFAIARKMTSEGEVFKKLCEITAGQINPVSYKTLQSFMLDLQLNVDGWFEGWWNNREDPRWQALL